MVKLNDCAKLGIMKLKSGEQSHASHQDENLFSQTQNLPLLEENSTYRQKILAIADQLQRLKNQLEHDKPQFPSFSWVNQQHQGETISYVGQNQSIISENPFCSKQIAHQGQQQFINQCVSNAKRDDNCLMQMEPTHSISEKGLQLSQPILNKCTSTMVDNAASGNQDVGHLYEQIPSQILPETRTTRRSSTALAVITTPMKRSGRLKKKPLEALDTPISQSIIKKVGTTGSSAYQPIEMLNDVVTSSAIDLKEEEEKLLCANIEGRFTEATKRLEKEEEISILEKDLLQKKLSQITTRCGIASIGNDVERCISMCVEERLRKLMPNLIRLSKQRVDIEKSMHQCAVTSDVRDHILSTNRKAKKDYANEQDEAVEKIPELSDTVKNTVKNAQISELINRTRSISAANSFARSAIGIDDVCAKWQLMAKEARQSKETGLEKASHVSKTGTTTGGKMNSAKSPAVISDPEINRKITINDVIAALEREPQMSKSTLLQRLYLREK